MQVIQHFLNNPLRNFNYIVGSDVTKEAVFIDPFDISQTLPLLDKEGFKAKYLLNTHSHHDHVRDNEKFLNLNATRRIEVEDGSTFELSKSEKIVCHLTPGHMLIHYCFFLYQDNKLESVISGDTLFNAGVGNCKNGGEPELLFNTIKNHFLPLSDHVKLWPGHDYFLNNLEFAKTVDPDNRELDKYIELRSKMKRGEEFLGTTIGEERKINPFFRAFEDDFQKQHNMNEKELFLWLRLQRDSW